MDSTQTRTDRTDGSGPRGEAVDLAPARRPGVPKERSPEPWPNTRFPPARMQGRPSAPTHGRSGKPAPPVFATAVPLHGLSGAIRRLAYRYPDHHLRHWSLLLLGDRVDAWGTRSWRFLRVAVPGVAVLLAARAVLARR